MRGGVPSGEGQYTSQRNVVTISHLGDQVAHWRQHLFFANLMRQSRSIALKALERLPEDVKRRIFAALYLVTLQEVERLLRRQAPSRVEIEHLDKRLAQFTSSCADQTHLGGLDRDEERWVGLRCQLLDLRIRPISVKGPKPVPVYKPQHWVFTVPDSPLTFTWSEVRFQCDSCKDRTSEYRYVEDANQHWCRVCAEHDIDAYFDECDF